jgi:hypothetical protein
VSAALDHAEQIEAMWTMDGCLTSVTADLRHPAASPSFPAVAARPAPLSSRRGSQRRQTWRLRAWEMGKETAPLWVRLSVALLAIGVIAYVTTVYFVEYIVGFF